MVINRFPIVILASVLSVICFIVAMEMEGGTHTDLYRHALKLAFTSILGIPLFFSIAVFNERKDIDLTKKFLVILLGIAVLVAYYFSVNDISQPQLKILGSTRFFHLLFCFHLLASFAAYINIDEPNGFYEFNKVLFIRFLTSFLFFFVLFIGLTLALTSIDKLLGVHIRGDYYLYLWLIVVFVFHTTFFLADVPKDYDGLDKVKEYSKGLKIFTQYILIPLTLVYFVILYIYAAKMAIVWELPRGWVAILVSGISILGLFSFLLLYPIRDRADNKWVRSYSKFFYIAIIPLVILHLTAVWRRVSDYGITEQRYFIFVLGVWLFAISIYFNFSKARNIKLIPISLFILAMLTSFGPWGVYSVSENSQVSRLNELLVKNKILVNNRIEKAKGEVSYKDRKQISSIVKYLFDTHRTDNISEWFEGGLDDKKDPYKIVRLMGIDPVQEWQKESTEQSRFNYRISTSISPTEIAGYKYAVEVALSSNESRFFDIDGHRYFLTINKNGALDIGKYQQSLINLNLDKVVDNIKNKTLHPRMVEPQLMTVEESNDLVKIKVRFTMISGQYISNKPQISSISADIFIELK